MSGINEAKKLAHFYQFHRGIDYAYPLGTPVFAVQGGTITAIKYQAGKAGFFIKIKSNDEEFAYLHLFSDALVLPNASVVTDGDGNLVLGTAVANTNVLGKVVPLLVTLEGPKSYLDWPPGCLAIVFWLDFAHNIPWYALSPCAGLSIGQPALLTTNIVTQGQMIAAVGESGAAEGAPHLHLQLNGGDQNALLYVQHDHSALPDYGIWIFKDKGLSPTELDANKVELSDGAKLDPEKDSPLVIRTEVNYHNAGHDLDRVHILMFKEGTTIPSLEPLDAVGNICVLDSRCRVFKYGGKGSGGNVSDIHCSAKQPCDVIQNGVYPQYGMGGGVVDFLTDPIDLNTLESGKYIILVRAFNIIGEGQSQAVTVTIGGTAKLTASAVCCRLESSSPTGPGCKFRPPDPCGNGPTEPPCPLCSEGTTEYLHITGHLAGPGATVFAPTLLSSSSFQHYPNNPDATPSGSFKQLQYLYDHGVWNNFHIPLNPITGDDDFLDPIHSPAGACPIFVGLYESYYMPKCAIPASGPLSVTGIDFVDDIVTREIRSLGNPDSRCQYENETWPTSYPPQTFNVTVTGIDAGGHPLPPVDLSVTCQP